MKCYSLKNPRNFVIESYVYLISYFFFFFFSFAFCQIISDTKKSVIYGNEPAILDSDRFSEISLDQTVDSEPIYSTAQQVYNPLQNLEPFIAEPDNRDESTFNPIAQATAIKDSLSQLPGVASSVLSSFSSILKGTSTSPQPSTPKNEPNLETYDPAPVLNQYQYPYYNYDQSSQSVETAPGPPPTFYSPTDSAILQPSSTLSSTDAQPSNSYRLKERKKIAYAPIPGFNANTVQTSDSILPTPPSATVIDSNIPKSNSSFSLTSFFSSPLIDKIQNTVLPPSKSIEQQSPDTIDISVQQTQSSTVTSNYSAPTQFFNPQAFNTQPFATKTNVSQPSIVNAFAAPSSAASNPQIFIPNTSAPTAAAPIFNPTVSSNLPPSIPLIPSQATVYPIEQAYLPPTALSLPVSSSTSAVSSPSQSPFPFQPPTSANATQSNLVPLQSYQKQSAQFPVPGPITATTQLPPSAAPQASTGYRLKGKPHYRRPPTESSYNTIPSQIQPLQKPLFNSFSSESTATSSNPAVNIFNPFAATADTPVQPSLSQSSTDSTFFVPQTASQINIFHPAAYQSEPTVPSQQLQPVIATLPPSISPLLSDSALSNPRSTTSPIAFLPSNASETPEAIPLNPVPQAVLSRPPTLPPTLPPRQNQPLPFVASIFDPTSTIHQTETSPFAEHQPQLLSTQPAHSQTVSFFAPTTEVKPHPTKTPSPALSADSSNNLQQSSTSHQQNTQNIFNLFESNAVQAQDFNPFRNQSLNNIDDTLNNLSLDSDNNNTSANNNSNESNELTPIDEPIQSEASVIDPKSFFNNNFVDDTPSTSASNNTNEFQIQNFFNNPPPLSDTQEVVQDKNFNFIGTNLLNKRIEKIASAVTRTGTDTSETLSLASCIVEPASSAQSEFSEYAEPPSNDIINRSVNTIYSSAAAAVAATASKQVSLRKAKKKIVQSQMLEFVANHTVCMIQSSRPIKYI